ncbi:unnamed protein product [Echinostoma caproni]|uniref:Plexin_cytopl domain-containing protein n=1 Tax=Echinostoma caproni TaxID=27848 RepID=A0A183AP98_9TREM|nr:unnamed protein product [Echinostoma caproni]
MLGSLSSPLADTIVSAWSPCSRTFALQLVMSWAKRLIELDEKNEPDSEKLHSNLARASYGVLENWVDMILLNKLGPYASNSVQIEPDPPSFFEEPLCPIGPSAQTVTPRLKETVIRKTEAMVQKAFDDQEKITPLTIILKDSKNSLDAAALSAFPNEWRELDLAWDHVIHKRLTAEPEASHTLIVDLNGTDESAEHRLPQLVHQIGQFARRFCPTSA